MERVLPNVEKSLLVSSKSSKLSPLVYVTSCCSTLSPMAKLTSCWWQNHVNHHSLHFVPCDLSCEGMMTLHGDQWGSLWPSSVFCTHLDSSSPSWVIPWGKMRHHDNIVNIQYIRQFTSTVHTCACAHTHTHTYIHMHCTITTAARRHTHHMYNTKYTYTCIRRHIIFSDIHTYVQTDTDASIQTPTYIQIHTCMYAQTDVQKILTELY